MIKSAIFSTQQISQKPILIVDKKGIIGTKIAKRLAGDFLVVLVTGNFSKDLSLIPNVVHVKFTKRIPQIPDNIYSGIFIIQDEESLVKEALDNFVLKSKRDDAPLYYLSWIGNSDQAILENVLSRGKEAKIFLYGDLFDDEFILNPHTVIGKYLNSAINKRKIEVDNEGLAISFPVYLDDFTEAVTVNTFNNSTSQIYYMFEESPVTDLSLSRIFKKNEPDLKIDFVKNEKLRKQINIPSGGEFVLKTNLEKEIAKILSSSNHPSEVLYLTKKEEMSYLKSYFLWLLIIFIFVLLLPLLTTAGYAYLGKKEIYNVKKFLDNGDLVSSKTSAAKAKSYFAISEQTVKYLKIEAGFIGLGKKAQDLESQISLGEKVSEGSFYLLSSLDKYKTIGEGKSADTTSDFNSAQDLLKASIADFREVEVLTSSYPALADKIAEIKPLIDIVSSSIDLPPKLLGFDKKIKYLVLFQNNMELRPTGGFIGSYGLLTVNKGRIESFTIHDVYDSDGQLKAHVEPPFAIRRFMAIPHLYLRDSGFDVSFANAAPVSANLLNLETNEKVDGVIAIDLTFVKNLLNISGPVRVGDYGVTLTSDNFFKEVEGHVQNNFFAGSTQKKDFLHSVFTSMTQGFNTSKNISYYKIAQLILSSLTKKDILISSSDKSTQDVFSANNWSDDLTDLRKNSGSTVNDFLSINEANIGVNKVNYFVTRSVSKTTEIKEDGTVVSNATISFKNSSSGKNSLGYSNYLRFVVPISSTLSSVSIDGVAQSIVPAQIDPLKYEARNFIPPQGLEVEEYNEDNKKVFGFLVIVPASSVKTVSVSYQLPNKVSLSSSSINYDLKLNKQPGIESYPFDLSLIYPDSFKALKIPTNFTSDGKVSFLGNIESDQDFVIKLSQK